MKLNFDEMMQYSESKPELRAKLETVDGVDVTIFSYMVSMTDTFSDAIAQEFRGTVFCNTTKECICRPLPKFFNVGEKETTLEHLIAWENAVFYTKHDGSMLTPVVINDKVFWKTKNTFFSDVAINAQKFYDRTVDEPEYAELYAQVRNNDVTQIFEYVGPGNQIVLPYEREELIFLGERHIETGQYTPAKELHVPGLTYSEILYMEDIEGFVIWDGNQLVKAKSMWYMERHKIASEFNVKAIIRATLDNTVDDMLGTIAQLGMTLRHFQVQQLRDEVVFEKMAVTSMVDTYWEMINALNLTTRKDFAIKINQIVPQEYRAIMFKLLDDKDVDEMINKIVYEHVYADYKPGQAE